jgi:hypothetical protein
MSDGVVLPTWQTHLAKSAADSFNRNMRADTITSGRLNTIFDYTDKFLLVGSCEFVRTMPILWLNIEIVGFAKFR